jgi:hypothetical protein
MTEEIITEEPEVIKSDTELIYEQEDHSETVIREEGGFGNIICTILSSEALGIKVLSIPQYIEEIENGILVGRRVVSYEKSTLAIDEEIAVNSLVVLSREIAERGR